VTARRVCRWRSSFSRGCSSYSDRPRLRRRQSLMRPGLRGMETTRVDVERSEPVIEIDVQPLTPRGSSAHNRLRDQLCANSPASRACGDHRVQKECVCRAVPRDVHEANQLVGSPRTHPAETVAPHMAPAVTAFRRRVVETLCVQRLDLWAIEGSSPFVSYRSLSLEIDYHFSPPAKRNQALLPLACHELHCILRDDREVRHSVVTIFKHATGFVCHDCSIGVRTSECMNCLLR
jgi:hypothetical protein